MDPTSTCFKCGREPYEILEYIEGAADESIVEEPMTPWAWMRREEGTYNPATNHFCCTTCWDELEEQDASGGWVAP